MALPSLYGAVTIVPTKPTTTVGTLARTRPTDVPIDFFSQPLLHLLHAHVLYVLLWGAYYVRVDKYLLHLHSVSRCTY